MNKKKLGKTLFFLGLIIFLGSLIAALQTISNLADGDFRGLVLAIGLVVGIVFIGNGLSLYYKGRFVIVG